MKNNRKNNQAGFSFIELILYVGLVSIFLSGTILFAWDVIYGRVKSKVQVEVNQNLRLAVQRISYEIKNASGINTVTASSISLSNSDSARNPTVIDLSSGRLRIGQGLSGSCPSTAPCNLTSNSVTVSALTFTDLSSGADSYNINYSITVDYNNDSGFQQWDKSESYSSSVEVRSN